MHITPNIIVPLIDRLIHFGILPEPKEDGYSVIWPDITAPTQMQKVDVGLKITESLTKFVQGGIGDSFMTKVDFLVEVLGFDEEKAQQISDNYDEEFPDGPPMDEELFPMPGEELNDEEEEEPGMPTKTGSNPVTDKKPLPGTAKPVVPGGKNKKASPQAGAGGNKDGKKPLPVGKK